MAVMALDHGAAADIWRHAAFKVHYPLRLIIEVDSPRVIERLCVRARGAKQKPSTPMANNKLRAGRERDPIAELAQLIAEADPYGGRAAPDNRFRQETASEGHDEAPGVPPAPQLPADVRAHEQAHELDEYRNDDEAYDAGNPPYASHQA